MRASRNRVWAMVLVAGLWLAPVTGTWADDESRAKELYQNGEALVRKGEYVEALSAFRAAIQEIRRPGIILSIAHTLRRLDQPEKALSHYEEYLAVWKKESPGTDPPHRAAVQGHIGSLRTVVDLVKRGDALFESGDAKAALAIYQTTLWLMPWPVLRLDIARCQHKLGQVVEALASVQAAIAYWEVQLAAWKKAHDKDEFPLEREARDELGKLRGLERLLCAPASRPAASPLTPVSRPPGLPLSPPASSTAPKPRRSALWLGLGIGALALAAGFEATAWVSFVKGNDSNENDPAHDRYRNMTIAGHVLAATLAAASGVSFYLFWRSRRSAENKSRPVGVLFVPTRDTVTVSAHLQF
jgi:tetratricopeptide (TPR) repeat protein